MARLDREIAETNRLAKEEFEANRREFERKVNEKLAESEKAMAEAIAKNREQNRQHQAVRLQRQAGRSDPSFVDLQNERFFDKDWRETSISAIAESKPWPVRPTVSTSEYVFSHAKSPRGSGGWMFEMTTGKGSAVWQSKLANYSEAKSRAVGIAKRIGAHTVKVMP